MMKYTAVAFTTASSASTMRPTILSSNINM